ncbi:unnamed protein product [Sphagnum jensenii]|uniref:Uncharacterized protein n=1 Tax=Sphagnum jensenii TaxID=128206 RepID=A0ABP0VI94_9BRYO
MVQQAAVQHQTDTDTLNNALAEQKRLSDLSQQAAGDLLAIQSSGTTPQPDSTATTPNTSGGSPAATQVAGIPTDVDHSCISSPPIRTILSRLRSRVPTTAAR